MEQNIEQWRIERLGMVTGSQISKLLVSDKKGGYKLSSSQTAKNLIYKIAWERLLKNGNYNNGLNRLNVSSKEIEHGINYESEAILKYELLTFNKVESPQKFIKVDDFLGGTPDGFIGDDGLIEVKCPWNGGNHLRTLLDNEVYNSDHIIQMQSYLMITKRKWCDFVTYDPDMIDGLNLAIIRIERDEDMIQGIKDILDMVKEKLTTIIENKKLIK